jgi:DNA uptake protein ComE-like DNA-binding protein
MHILSKVKIYKWSITMNKRKNFIGLVFLGMLLLAACSSTSPDKSSSGIDTIPSQSFTGTKLNLNTVSGDDLLATIPGFPNRMIREFQEYRPYVSIQQFRKEIGKYVSSTQVAEYEQYIYVPISFNTSDAETLQQIPGLDATEVDALISARPFGTQNDFLKKLGEYVSIDELETGKSYLGES